MTKPLDPNVKLDIEHILENLENYHPPRKGWTWRNVPAEGVNMGPFHFRNMSAPLKNSIGLPASQLSRKFVGPSGFHDARCRIQRRAASP